MGSQTLTANTATYNHWYDVSFQHIFISILMTINANISGSFSVITTANMQYLGIGEAR